MGLVGSRVVELLKDRYEFDFSDVDITDRSLILKKIKSSDAQIVLHLAAKTDVDGCELDKSLRKDGKAWKVNVEGTRNVADACFETNKKLIYISTDFVFDGTREAYSEEDTPNPINWYGQTKYEGEKIVRRASCPWLIVRFAYPYRANFGKLDFAREILERLQMGKKIKGITDHIFTPTFIDNIAFALDVLIGNNSRGIFHVVGDQSLTPHDAGLLIAKTFNLDQNLISKSTRAEFFKDRAPRPFQLSLKNDKIEKLGIKMRTFEGGLKEIKKQI